MSTPDLAAQAQDLKDHYRNDDSKRPTESGRRYAEDLKDLVQMRLEESNPTAQVERTPYFNHSAIPDFILSWDLKKPRGMYLRGSYAAIMAASEVGTGRQDDPIFMSLDQAKEFTLAGEGYDRARIADAVANSEATLVTDLSAFSAATSPTMDVARSPLQTLVRSNFVRGGRGLFDGEQVDQLVRDLDLSEEGSVLEEIGGLFTEQTQTEFQRVAAILDLSRTSSDAASQTLDVAHLLRGRLSEEEVRSLLPWIVANSPAPTGAPVWHALGSMIDLALLEKESASLQKIDLTRLIESNLGRFVANRAYAGLNVDANSDPSRWEMVGSTLTRMEGATALKFAWLGTRLKSTGSFAAPRWNEIKERLAPYTLDGAAISGLYEIVRVDSRRGRSIRDYLERAIPTESADEYFVDDVTIRLDGAGPEGEDRDVKVDFPSRLVVPTGPTSLGALVDLVGLLDALNPELLEGDLES